jgi:hypothetical protein
MAKNDIIRIQTPMDGVDITQPGLVIDTPLEEFEYKKSDLQKSNQRGGRAKEEKADIQKTNLRGRKIK